MMEGQDPLNRTIKNLSQTSPHQEPQDLNDDVVALCGHPTLFGRPCKIRVRRKVGMEQVTFCHIHSKPEIRMQNIFVALPLEISYAILGLLDPIIRVALALCNKYSLAIVQGGSPYRRHEQPDFENVHEIHRAIRQYRLDLLIRWRHGHRESGVAPGNLSWEWSSEDIDWDFEKFASHGSIPPLLFFTMQRYPFLFNFASRDTWSCLFCPRTIRDTQRRYTNFTIDPPPVWNLFYTKVSSQARYHERFELNGEELLDIHRYLREILCCDHWPTCQEEDHDNTFWKRVRQGARPAYGLQIARLYWATQNSRAPSL